jgi:hypothetical protein
MNMKFSVLSAAVVLTAVAKPHAFIRPSVMDAYHIKTTRDIAVVSIPFITHALKKTLMPHDVCWK